MVTSNIGYNNNAVSEEYIERGSFNFLTIGYHSHLCFTYV